MKRAGSNQVIVFAPAHNINRIKDPVYFFIYLCRFYLPSNCPIV